MSGAVLRLVIFVVILKKKFNLEHGRLKDEKAIAELCDQVEDDYEEEKKRKKREAEKKERCWERKKKAEEEKDKDKDKDKDKNKKPSEKPKRRRDSSSEERPSKKSKRHSSSDSESSERKHKSRRKPKKDLDNPDIQRIERLKKVIRGCGVPLTGFTKTMSNDRTLRKLKQIIAEHESDGMREKMTRSEMMKVRSAIEANREVEELKRIPKKLQISGKHPRKATRKKLSYDTDLPKTGYEFIDKDSTSVSESESRESTSNYSNS